MCVTVAYLIFSIAYPEYDSTYGDKYCHKTFWSMVFVGEIVQLALLPTILLIFLSIACYFTFGYIGKEGNILISSPGKDVSVA